MPYYPNIPGYASFFVQASGDASAVNILTQYGVVVRNHDYPLDRTPKAPYKNDWHDENGDDEYLGEGLFFEAFTFKAECMMMTKEADSVAARNVLRSQLKALQDKLSGGEFSIFDAWTRFGFRKVRLASFPSSSSEDFRAIDGKARLFFTIEFKVNDPATRMVLVNNRIVEEI